MSKYEPLGMHLHQIGKESISLSFEEMEQVLGFSLPPYLYKYEARWYGTAEASPTHVQKAVWQNHGYSVETVDLNAFTVVFKKL